MNKTLKKGFMVSVLSLSLVLSLASISLAMEGMDNSPMPGMKNNTSKSTVLYEANFDLASTESSEPHEATSGMDANMPGMENNSASADGHGGTKEAVGVNWTVVGGFLAINLLVIGTAGVLKFTKKPKLEVLV